jgi:hypothetical protein
MNNFKNKLFVILALASTGSNIKLHAWRGGGAFLGGALVGTTVTLAATSGSRRGHRDPAYDDYQDRKAQRVEINREIRRHKNEINHHHRELRKLDSNKHLDDTVRNSRREEHKGVIADLEQAIKDLREDLRNLF